MWYYMFIDVVEEVDRSTDQVVRLYKIDAPCTYALLRQAAKLV